MRFLSSFFIFIILQSCSNFTFSKKEDELIIDSSFINYKSVDSCPTFNNCKELIDKEAKDFCFRQTIYKKIAEQLREVDLKSNDSIKESVLVLLKIDNKGSFSIDSVISTSKLKASLPNLDSIIFKSIKKLPEVFPATKRGIPVTTVYELPIELN